MGRFTDADMDRVLDLMFGDNHDTGFFPATWYVALSTTQPTNSGASVTEPSGGSYARVGVANTTANWPAASGRLKANGVDVTFPTPTGSWGTIGWFALYDALTAGTFHAWGALSVARSIDATSDPPVFPVGQLVIPAPGT